MVEREVKERKSVESKIWPKFSHWRFWLVRGRRDNHWITRRKDNCSILQKSSSKLNWRVENANVRELNVYWPNDDVLLSGIVDTCVNYTKFDLKRERLLSRWDTEGSSLTLYKCWQTSEVTRVLHFKEKRRKCVTSEGKFPSTGESLSMKFINSWKAHLARFRIIWKTIGTCMAL